MGFPEDTGFPTDYVGIYGDFLFDESKNYLALLQQELTGIYPPDTNANQLQVLTYVRRAIQDIVGDSFVGSAFQITQAVAPANDFAITTSGGSLEGTLRGYLRGFPLRAQTAGALYSNQVTTLNGGIVEVVPPVLTTPIANRTDSVYIDMYLAEITNIEDGTRAPINVSVSLTNALKVIIQVLVAEGGSTPARYVDSNGNQHETVQIATFNRLAGNNNITTAMIVDDRNIFPASSMPSFFASITGNLNSRLKGGGTWHWNLSTNTVSLSSSAYVIAPETLNQLVNGSNVPIPSFTLVNEGDCAYIELNRGAVANCQVQFGNISTLLPDLNTFIFARRQGSQVLISSQLLSDKESLSLDDSLSANPKWSSLGAPLRIVLDSDGVGSAIVNLDIEINKFFGQFQLLINPSNAGQVEIFGADRLMRDGVTTLSTQDTNQFVYQPNNFFDFTTGMIYGPDDSTVVGAFSLSSIPVGEYLWYGVGFTKSGVTGINQATVTYNVIPASGPAASPAAAPLPTLTGDVHVGAVLIFNNAGTLQVSAVRQFPSIGASGAGGGGSSSVLVQQEVPQSVGGDPAVYSIALVPKSGIGVAIFVNRLIQVQNVDYTIAGQVITFTNPLSPGQVPYAFYVINSTNPFAGFQETPSGGVNSTNGTDGNNTFLLSGMPGNKLSTFVYVNRALVPAVGWNLVQTLTSSSITFNPGYNPIIGQDVYVFYFVNVPVAGGGGPALTPFDIHGSESAPVSIDPAIGITPTSSLEQMWFIRPLSGVGQVLITSTPPIAAGTVVGQRLTLISVASPNYLRIPKVTGVIQSGPVDFGPYDQVAVYVWGGLNWILQSTVV